MDISLRIESVGIEQCRIAVNVIPPVVVVTAQVGHLPKVPKRRRTRGVAQRLLEVGESNGAFVFEQMDKHFRGAFDHNDTVYLYRRSLKAYSIILTGNFLFERLV